MKNRAKRVCFQTYCKIIQNKKKELYLVKNKKLAIEYVKPQDRSDLNVNIRKAHKPDNIGPTGNKEIIVKG